MFIGSHEIPISFEFMINHNGSQTALIEKDETLKDRPFLGWLAVLEGLLRGEAFHLYNGRNRIGSSSPSEIQIPDEGIQDQHLSIRISSQQWMATDLDSETGTFLNGRRVYREELKDGDKIKVGKAVLQIKIL